MIMRSELYRSKTYTRVAVIYLKQKYTVGALYRRILDAEKYSDFN